MATAQSSSESVTARLMASVKGLTPKELGEFKRQFAAWQQANGGRDDDEAALVEACKARLPSADQRRFKTLVGKSERGALRPDELDEYRKLVGRAEQIDAARLAALTQLARFWGQPVRAVMEIIGERDRDEAAARHSAGSAKARARSRR